METRILLLGLGFWGTEWRAVIERTPGCVLAGVAAGPATLARHGLDGSATPVWTDYRAAIDEAAADVAVIVIPTVYHVDAATRALRRGLHVICEKPLADGQPAAEQIRAEARRHPHLSFAVNQNYRWRSHNQALRQAILDGRIGAPATVDVEFRQPEMLLGARATLDMPLLEDVSIHHFDLLRALLGCNATEVYARSFRPPWSHFRGLPATEAIIMMESGAVVSYSGTWAARGRYTLWEGNIRLTGPKGSLTLDEAGAVRLFADEGPDDDAFTGFEPRAEHGELLPPPAASRPELDETLALFLESIRSGTPAPTSIEDNFHSFAMVTAAIESARSGKPALVPG